MPEKIRLCDRVRFQSVRFSLKGPNGPSMNTSETSELQKRYAEALRCHEQDRLKEAIHLYRSILNHYPDADLVLYNLGHALYGLGSYEEAAENFLSAAALNPEDPDYWFNGALALKQAKRYAEALDAYRKAHGLQGEDGDILYNMGCCYQAAGDRRGAIEAYEKALAVSGEHSSILNNLAYCTHLDGDYGQALTLYRQLLELRPDHHAARHMVEALEERNTAAPSPEYVRQLFDGYSESFDRDLVDNLSYRVPGLLRDLVFEAIGPGGQEMRVVDLGCGTGLSGRAVAEYASYLVGVDLSAKMLEQAEAKACYDQLIVDDVIGFLTRTKEEFDLLFAADVLTYLGDLAPLFRAAAGCATGGALFCFSTEHEEREGWRLRPTGRYGHHRQYVEEMAGDGGWAMIRCKGAGIRKERQQWIAGDLYLFEKS